MSTSTIRPALHQPTGPAHTRIYAYGAARGENAVPNDDLVGPIAVSYTHLTLPTIYSV